MLINLVFQPPEAGWWAQSTDVFEVDFTTLDEAEVTDEGLYHYEVQMSLRDILSIEDDMELRNIILILQKVTTLYLQVDCIWTILDLKKEIQLKLKCEVER